MQGSNVAQCARRGHIAYRVTRRMTQNIIRHADQGVFLAEHITVLTDDSETIYIGVHHKTNIGFAGFE